MLAGLIGRSVLEPLAASRPWLAPAAVSASALEAVAAALFVWVVAATLRAARKPLACYDLYILSALAWFLIQAVCETVYLAATLAAADEKQLVGLIALWQGSLRDIQIHGFATLMILGVSQRALHHFFGLPAPGRWVGRIALPLLNLAVIGEATGLVLRRALGHGWIALWYGSVIVLALTVIALLCDWRVFSRARDPDRSLKFLRAAYVWLPVSLGMLLLLPLYQLLLLPRFAPQSEAVRIGFSHAFYGATRHAVTVGFVSLMIVGVAARVVPTLNGLDPRRLTSLWGPFVLLNVGCATRVVAQTLTDFTPAAYPVAGASGLLEVLALALWGAHLWRIMSGRVGAGEAPEHAGLAPGEPVAAGHLVGDVLERDPHLLDVFLSFGFHPLANPLLRRTVGGRVTVGRAGALLGVDAAALLAALNAARGPAGARRTALPLLSPAAAACGGAESPGPAAGT